MLLGGSKRISAIMVMGDGDLLCTPCGNCRQRIREFAKPTTPVHVAGREAIRQSFTLATLLPHSFGPENLA